MNDKNSITVGRSVFAAGLAVVCSTECRRLRGTLAEKCSGTFPLKISAVNRFQNEMACSHPDGGSALVEMGFFYRDDNRQCLMALLQFFQDGDPVEKWQMEVQYNPVDLSPLFLQSQP